MAKQKQKVTVPGLVGWTLLDTAKHHGLLTHCTHADSPWDYNTFGEGPMSAEDHVVVSRDFFDKVFQFEHEGCIYKLVSSVADSENRRPKPDKDTIRATNLFTMIKCYRSPVDQKVHYEAILQSDFKLEIPQFILS